MLDARSLRDKTMKILASGGVHSPRGLESRLFINGVSEFSIPCFIFTKINQIDQGCLVGKGQKRIN